MDNNKIPCPCGKEAFRSEQGIKFDKCLNCAEKAVYQKHSELKLILSPQHLTLVEEYKKACQSYQLMLVLALS